ncbi:3828_t:CDS:2 [Diversispora eburnea]|uniref:3828_t:CDS:1 n=1 Tax=Diversispora eburnea TaxID=1213867 RepID=A0A9N8YNP7_9GLOM|nr:3828_t:CDS:2 [Diversispora eburnea]
MSAKQSPEEDQLELIELVIGSNTLDKSLLNLVMNFTTTEKQTYCLLECTRDSRKSIIQNRETISSEIWLKISKFVENHDKKELDFNTLSLDPSLLITFAPKTPKDLDNEPKTEAFSSSPLILEDSVKNLQSSSKQKLSDKSQETEETPNVSAISASKSPEETPNVSNVSAGKSSETKRKSEKQLSKSNKRTKKYTKQSEIEGTSIMTYPVKENSHTTLIWNFAISPQNYYSHQSQQEITIPNIQEIPIIQEISDIQGMSNIQETMSNFPDFQEDLFTAPGFNNTTTEVDNSEKTIDSNDPHSHGFYEDDCN